MTKGIHALILLAIITGCIVVAGCSGNGEPVSPIPTPAPATDLTNQNSPLAATFSNGGSHTPLVTSRPLIGLEKIAGGFSSPMMIVVPPDGTGRLFVVDQIGLVKIITPDNKVQDTPFLDRAGPHGTPQHGVR